MKIKGKVHCFFEQSGTFKKQFVNLGIPAEDYDIQNEYGETDHVTDLFKAIEDAYDGKPSIFDGIGKDDFIMSFFPCIYFCNQSQELFYTTNHNYCNLDTKGKYDAILERNENRAYFFGLLLKMFAVVRMRGLRMVVENPWTGQTYLKTGFISPTIVDTDRTRRGDVFRKPTAYWFVGCEPTNGFTLQQTPLCKIKRVDYVAASKSAGVCSRERSEITPDYARNFICDWVLGIKQQDIDPQLF